MGLDTTAQRREAAPRVGRAMREAADETEEIVPPEDIAASHDAYTAALRRCAGRFEEILARDGLKDRIFEALAGLPCVEEMRAAVGAIAAKGYRVEDPV